MRFLELWLIENSLVAGLFALLVLVLSHVLRPRPAMEHVLWVAVLLKFVTPPVSFWPDGWHTPLPAWMSAVATRTSLSSSPPMATDVRPSTTYAVSAGDFTKRRPRQDAPRLTNAPQLTASANQSLRALPVPPTIEPAGQIGRAHV